MRSSRIRRVLRRWTAVGVVVAGVLLGSAATAGAHADLVSSSPGPGTVVGREPLQVVLRFSEGVVRGLSSVTVVGPDGRRADDGVVRGDGADDVVVVRLRPDAAMGTFAVRWRVTAADDGHATEGVVTFSVGSATPGSGAVSAAGTAVATSAAGAVRNVAVWAGFVGLALLAGIGVVPTGPRRVAVAGWVLVVGGAVVELFVYGVAVRGGGLGDVFDRGLMAATLGSRVGHALLARLGMAALVAVCGEGVVRRGSAAGAAVLVLGLSATWSAASHAASGPQVGLALVATTVHVAAMGAWAGGLVTLGVMVIRWRPDEVGARHDVADTEDTEDTASVTAGRIRTRPATSVDPAGRDAAVGRAQVRLATSPDAADLAAAASRFSRAALAAVTALAVTGVYQAWRGLGTVDALLTTGYGRLLVIKVLVLELTLGAAVRSRAHAADADLPALRRSIAGEVLGVAAVLAVTVLLLGTQPGRTGRA